MVEQAASIANIAIAKSYHDKKGRGICEPVLVADVTSTGYFSPPCSGVRYEAIVQCVVVCSLGAPFPS